MDLMTDILINGGDNGHDTGASRKAGRAIAWWELILVIVLVLAGSVGICAHYMARMRAIHAVPAEPHRVEALPSAKA